MQYGNFDAIVCFGFPEVLFKSYYVVWKPKNPKILGSTISMFKSYYVVWKHECIFFFRHFRPGLNRTMQYGNLLSEYGIILLFSGLNRTMQYGNYKSKGRTIKYTSSLNRTMQYGNSFSPMFEYSIGSPFKSYYVVWKQIPQAKWLDLLIQFKSYYVVWKQYSSTVPNPNISGLNRTMQYGNFVLLHRHTLYEPGLNRTMQYGNQMNFQQRFQKRTMFKSYYVVWKPSQYECEAQSTTSV